jgi:hypothetical protein
VTCLGARNGIDGGFGYASGGSKKAIGSCAPEQGHHRISPGEGS